MEIAAYFSMEPPTQKPTDNPAVGKIVVTVNLSIWLVPGP